MWFFPYPIDNYLGTQNILTIVSTEKVNLSEVHLLHHNSGQFKPLVLPLNDEKISNAAEYLYETDAFDPLDVPFKISVFLILITNQIGLEMKMKMNNF